MASPAVAGAAALLLQRHPQLDAGRRPLGARADRAAGLRRPRTHGRGAAARGRLGPDRRDGRRRDAACCRRRRARTSGSCGRRRRRTVNVELRDAGSGAGIWTVSAPGLSAPATLAVPAGGEVALAADARTSRPAPARQPAGLRACSATATQSVRIRWWGYVERPRLGASPVRSRGASARSPATRARGTLLASRYALPRAARGQLGLPSRYPGREQVLSFRVPRGARNAGVRVIAAPSSRRCCSRRTRTGSRARRRSISSRTPTSTATAIASRSRALLLPAAGRYYVSVETQARLAPGPLPPAHVGERHDAADRQDPLTRAVRVVAPAAASSSATRRAGSIRTRCR